MAKGNRIQVSDKLWVNPAVVTRELNKDVKKLERRVDYLLRKAARVNETLQLKKEALECEHSWGQYGVGSVRCSKCNHTVFVDI